MGTIRQPVIRSYPLECGISLNIFMKGSNMSNTNKVIATSNNAKQSKAKVVSMMQYKGEIKAYTTLDEYKAQAKAVQQSAKDTVGLFNALIVRLTTITSYDQFKPAAKVAAETYIVLQKLVGNEIKLDSAQKHVRRQIVKLVPSYKELKPKSTSKAAVQKRTARAASQPETQTPAVKAKQHYTKQVGKAEVLKSIDTTLASLYDAVSGHMPANVLAAFVTSVDALKKTVHDTWK